jgi:hypothetical protein
MMAISPPELNTPLWPSWIGRAHDRESARDLRERPVRTPRARQRPALPQRPIRMPARASDPHTSVGSDLWRRVDTKLAQGARIDLADALLADPQLSAELREGLLVVRVRSEVFVDSPFDREVRSMPRVTSPLDLGVTPASSRKFPARGQSIPVIPV